MKLFKVRFQHREVMCVPGRSFTSAINDAKRRRPGSGIRSIKLCSRYEVRRHFGGLTKVPKRFKEQALVGTSSD